MAFQIDGQRHESSSGSDDDTRTEGLIFWRRVGREGGGDHVEDHPADGCVFQHLFFLSPMLGAGRRGGTEFRLCDRAAQTERTASVRVADEAGILGVSLIDFRGARAVKRPAV